jgi:hypothetical protein
MPDRTRNDIARQAANLVGAVAQAAAGPLGFLVGLDIGAVSDQNRTTVVPANYAFAIWGPIFLLAFGYALYQALPGQRANPLLRRIGWWTAGAFACNAVWELLFPSRQFLLAQVVIVGIWLCLAVAFVRIVAALRSGSTAGERWLVALPIGLMFGWLTAAATVSIATTAVALGADATGTGATVGGAALLLLGGGVAAGVVARAQGAPAQTWGPYLLAVLWALAAVAVDHAGETPPTAATAAALAVVLAAVTLLVHRPRRSGAVPAGTAPGGQAA